jgi:hypothetical protein
LQYLFRYSKPCHFQTFSDIVIWLEEPTFRFFTLPDSLPENIT